MVRMGRCSGWKFGDQCALLNNLVGQIFMTCRIDPIESGSCNRNGDATAGQCATMTGSIDAQSETAGDCQSRPSQCLSKLVGIGDPD